VLGVAGGAAQDFHAEVLRVFRDVAGAAIADGVARLEEGEDGGELFLRLVPLNPSACSLTIYPDYPTLCLGPDQHCTEMFGSEERRLRELPQLVEAVIEGRYEWRHRQVRHRLLRFLPPYTQLVGTFHTTDGPWTFTRQGAEPAGAVDHHVCESYRSRTSQD